MTLCHWVSVCNRLEGSWCLRLHCLVLVYEDPNLLCNIRKHPPNDILSQPDRPESQLHCRVNVRSFIFSRIQATTYRWLHTVLSVTDCVQMLRIAPSAVLSVTIWVQLQLIADSALFYPWPSVYNCCVLLFLHCFVCDYLRTTASYRWLRTISSLIICMQLSRIAHSVLFFRDHRCGATAAFRWLHFLSVTIFVQMLLIADCALFNPWSSVYNCCFSLTLHCFICDHLYTTAVSRWLHTI